MFLFGTCCCHKLWKSVLHVLFGAFASFGQTVVCVALSQIKVEHFLVLCQRIRGEHKSYDIHYENSAVAGN